MIWTSTKNILVFLLALFLVMQNYYVCAAFDCNEVCYSGEYCNVTICVKCNNGSYMDARAHKYTACKPWTQKNGPGWVIVNGGNTTKDIEWACANGYQEINSSGFPECIMVTQRPTLVSFETTTKLNYSSVPLVTTQSPSEEINIPGIVISVIAVVLVVCIIFFFLWYYKKACFSSKQKPKDPSVSYDNKKENDKVDDGSTVETPLLESGGLNGKNGDNSNHSPVKDTPNQSNNDAEEIDDAGDLNKFHKANHSNNADDSYNLNIPINDPGDGNKNRPTSLFPGGSLHSSLKNNMSQNDNQISDVENRLYNAIEIFAYKLCEKLGTQADIIIHQLQFKKFPDSDYKTSFKLGFSDWVRRKQFSYSQTKNGLWYPLDRLKVIIDQIERRDIIEEFDSNCKDITQILHEIQCQEQ
ncbi:hypothetical protein Bpfe_011142 [Biomphalaria pfeifferi]|uniref:Sushi domain-containing protein n=1 Tax=Biomphalaria pfeifferi TaxID=112525 RepID=A0AAD8FD20_BIOPF|nr:hypothetical protein Bpfe_011142 [Biomphalaria pfeifferi]